MTKRYPSIVKQLLFLSIFLGLNGGILAQTYTIPTVVHIITSNSEPVMLTDAQVQAGIENLNKQFSGEYANSILNTIIPQHQSFINNANITFELATKDPNGNTTNGITRDYNETWSTSAVSNQIPLKSALKWDRSKYFNIYVVERLNSSNQSGLAYRPSSVNDAQDAVKDGALVTFRIWPTSFPLSGDQWSGFEGTMAHEVGHYFNLTHTWGSSNSSISCSDPDCTDFVADTPKHSATLDGYQANQQSIGCDGTVAMTDNFMTYSRHQCLFTPGQVTRMHNALNSSLSARNNLWTPANLQMTGVGSGNPPPPITYCSATGRIGTDTDYITNVSVGDINHNSGKSDYSNFTAISTDLVKGNAYSISVEIDTEWGQDQAYVWVDWNEDQIFDNSTELVSMSPYDDNVTLAYGTLTVPSNIPLGSFRMRVRNIYASPNNPEPCGDIYGEVEDYTLNIVESSGYCSATGRIGTDTDYITNVSVGDINHNSGQSAYSDFTSISTDLVKGNAYSISVEIDTEWGQDQAYVWVDWNDDQIFNNNSELVSMSPYGNNVTLASGTLTVPSNAPLGAFRMRVRNIYASPNNPEPCGDIYGEVEDYTLNIVASSGYCSATGRAGTGTDYITNVSVGSIDHNSGQSDYSDFTSISTDLVKGNAYTISVEIDTEWGQDQAYVWVDWNEDQIFDNNSELVSMSPYGNNVTLASGTLTVPSNSPLGAFRMRVRNIYASPNNPEPCGDIYGEVEDYTINVIADLGACLDNQISLELQLDDYPDETSWQITDINGIIVAAGGTYDGQDGELILEDICLPNGCYDFTIDDAYGDGICCGYGNGSYSLTNNNGQVLASGSQFISNETTNFCLGAGGNCTPQVFNNQTFESGWGIWNDGGIHARRNVNDASFANNGSFCARLRNKTVESVITTDNLDLSGFSEITVDFSYVPESFENTEDFWLQISTDGGATFSLVEDWINTVDFQNGQRQNPSVTINGPFSSNTQIRFRCDASGNGDKVYLDDIVITGCSTSANRLIPVDDKFSKNEEALQTIQSSTRTAEVMAVYPNPVSTELTVKYQAFEADQAMIDLYNLSGQKVLSQAVYALKGINLVQLKVNEIPDGMYFLNIRGANINLTKQVVIAK